MLFEPQFGWRVLWLQGFPTGLLLLALARFIPESPRFLAEQGATRGARRRWSRKFGIVARPRARRPPTRQSRLGAHRPADPRAGDHARWRGASSISACCCGFRPTFRRAAISSSLASGIIASSALIALPTIVIAAWLYSRWSSKWTLVVAAS